MGRDREWQRHDDPRPTPRRLYAVTEAGDFAYVFGGAGEDNATLDDLWRVDRETLEFERVRGRGHASGARYAGTLITDSRAWPAAALRWPRQRRQGGRVGAGRHGRPMPSIELEPARVASARRPPRTSRPTPRPRPCQARHSSGTAETATLEVSAPHSGAMPTSRGEHLTGSARTLSRCPRDARAPRSSRASAPSSWTRSSRSSRPSVWRSSST